MQVALHNHVSFILLEVYTIMDHSPEPISVQEFRQNFIVKTKTI